MMLTLKWENFVVLNMNVGIGSLKIDEIQSSHKLWKSWKISKKKFHAWKNPGI